MIYLHRQPGSGRAGSILFITHSVTSGHRVEHYFPLLEKAGYRAESVPFPPDRAGRRTLWRRCADAEFVILHRKLLSGPDWSALRHSSRRLIFDFDDAICYRSSRHRTRFSPARWWKFRRTLRGADFVTAGNRYLEALARRHTPHTAMIPTAIDCDRFRKQDDAQPETPPVIGWVGRGEVHLPYLKLLKAPIERLAREIPLKLRLIGTKDSPAIQETFSDLKHAQVECIAWVPFEEIPRQVERFSVGVMPLTPDPYAKGKCALKALEYMAMEVPTVVSPVGVNTEIIRDGVNGFLAETPEEWHEKLKRLLTDPPLGKGLGQAGRRTVIERYSVEAATRSLIENLESLLSPV
jgi:glycosyltransferase involved in cell wall biosynthesis